MESFDDLFHEFFKKPLKKKANNFDNINLPDDMPQEIKDFIGTILNFKDKPINPDNNETKEDGTNFEQKTWETDFGSVTRITVSGPIDESGLSNLLNSLANGSNNPISKTKNLSLEEQLEEAEKVEDYEQCARLRDEINKRNKK